MKLTDLPHPNTVCLLDKSVWTALTREQHFTLNCVSTIALAPVLYEEVRSSVVPRRKTKDKPEDRLAKAAMKGVSYRTYALPAAWKLIESELIGRSVQVFHGVPVDVPYIVDEESKGIIFDQPEEISDLQRWSAVRKASTEEIEAAKSWRKYLEDFRAVNKPGRRESKEDADAIQELYDDSVREATNVVAEFTGLANALGLLGFSRAHSFKLAQPCENRPKRWIQRDAPYTFRSIALELFMRKAVRKWPWRGANRADFMYFHYLPFCDIFATDDKTQVRFAIPWLKRRQRLVGTEVLRKDLDEIQEIRSRNRTENWDFPPRESNGLLASTLDTIRPGWRTETYRTLSSDELRALNEGDTPMKLTRKLEQALSRGERVPARHSKKGEQISRK